MNAEEKVNILLVDDRPEELLALEAALADLGLDLVKASSGVEALRCLLDQSFALVLLDASMPGMDGFETASLMRQREKTHCTPIIFLTAIHKAGEQVFKGYSTGAVDYLFKPLTTHVLRSKVQAFVELYKARRQTERHSEMLASLNRQLTEEIERRKIVEDELRDLNEKLEERVRERTVELHALSSHIQTTREDERARIAREIHDELGQVMTALKIEMTQLPRLLREDQGPLAEKIASLVGIIDLAIQSVRDITHDLRPSVLDDLGLLPALRSFSSDFEKRTGIKCRLEWDFEERPFDRETSTVVFRIFQESLTNVARHAQASSVRASLTRGDGGLVMKVEDDGIGIGDRIDSSHRFGILGMRERAEAIGGELKVAGAAGKGTVVTLRVPVRD
jgi:signal transduction histidine kinase